MRVTVLLRHFKDEALADSILDRAEAAGYGDEHIAAMVKVLGGCG